MWHDRVICKLPRLDRILQVLILGNWFVRSSRHCLVLVLFSFCLLILNLDLSEWCIIEATLSVISAWTAPHHLLLCFCLVKVRRHLLDWAILSSEWRYRVIILIALFCVWCLVIIFSSSFRDRVQVWVLGLTKLSATNFNATLMCVNSRKWLYTLVAFLKLAFTS